MPSLFDACAARFAALGRQTPRELEEQAGTPVELFRGRGWRTVGWGDLEVTCTQTVIETMVLESFRSPPRTPLITPLLADLFAQVTGEQWIVDCARHCLTPARIVRAGGAIELRAINGFSLVLAEGRAGCGWARAHDVTPVDSLPSKVPPDPETLLGLAIGHSDEALIQPKLTLWGDRNPELRWAAVVAFGLQRARGTELSQPALDFLGSVCEDERWAREFCRASGTRLRHSPVTPAAEYRIGDRVATRVDLPSLTPRAGTVWRRVWHHADRQYDYYLESAGRTVSRRYRAGELQPA